jgi:hypothetical protein
MLATLRKVMADQYRNYEIPEMAKRQMTIFKQEFSRYIDFDNEEMSGQLEQCLNQAMIVKLDLLISRLHNKVAFIPSGTVFDSNWMSALDDYACPMVMKKNTKYRVRICVSPALIMNVPEPDWQDGNPPDPENRQDYRDALLQSRNFFPEVRGQWNGWPGSLPAHKAAVVVEEVPRGAGPAT